ncbi:PAS domain S-box-containing protein/diguanylate cyclase (GGDEF)-like protein [Marinobacterium halophilum]|uniref:PAS domain S-box-containing protein/diguanylate cyclase (GGDEF)-like protein n=1 Tax=Marinobacterium halophilum TaxID=267374 RepID=A0A2P8EUD1_9GAMM|nr:sensor domain-containing diguanylate cyclase [Marinobacterium halophilum]PSL13073.1 PAS domain S-box-containing protein/diguanylate cyclase (GGDEF)-like protein [Marinobacterium halophilum]
MRVPPLQVSQKAGSERRALWHPMIAGALALLFIMSGMLAWGLYQDYKYSLESAGERLQTQLRAYASALDIALMSTDHVMHDVSQILESDPQLLEQQPGLRPLFIRSMMTSPSLDSLVLYNQSGEGLVSVGRAEGVRQSSPKWVRSSIAVGSHMAMGIDNGQLGLARLVYGPDSRVIGSLLATIAPEQIEAELESDEAYGNQHLMLLDSQNKLMLVAGDHDQQKMEELLVELQRHLTLNEFSAFGTRLVLADEHLYAIRQLGQQPVRALAVINRSEALAGWQKRLLISLLSLGSLMLVTLFFLKRWHDSLVRERKAANDLAHLYQAIEQMPSAIAITDLECRILYMNRTYWSRSGYDRNQVLGEQASIFSSAQTPESTYLDLWSHLEQGRVWEGEFINRMSDGQQCVEQAMITPVNDVGGRTACYFAIITDITEKKENEKRLLRYGEIVDASSELMVMLDRDFKHRQVNRQYLSYHSCSRSDVENQSIWQLYDDSRIQQLLRPRLDAALKGIAFVLEDWIDFAGMGSRYCRITGNPVSVPGGQIESLVLNLADITERKQSEDALRASEERFRALADFSPIGIFEADSEGSTIYANRYFMDTVGSSLAELNSRGWASILHPDDFKPVLRSWKAMTAQQMPDWHYEARIIDRDVDVRWFRCAARRYESVPDGETRYIGMVLDITQQVQHREELERKNEKLERLSTTDGLTGLLNRARIESLLMHQIHLYERYGKAFSLMMLDVDFFKQVNDSCGHAVGDQVLRQLADLMQENTRITDFPGRWGGEEFMILCPNTDLSGAHKLAENLRHRIEQIRFPVIGQRTCSFGVATLRPGDHKGDLLKRVDDALYRAKENGRNQVITEQS